MGNDEEFNFCEIPPHIQQNIIEKLDFRDFTRFQQCSQYSLSVSNRICSRIECVISCFYLREGGLFFANAFSDDDAMIPVGKCDYFPVKIHADSLVVTCSLDAKRCKYLCDVFERLEATVLEVIFQEEISCKPETFNRLISLCGFRFLKSSSFVKHKYMSQPALRNITSIACPGCHCRNEDLLMLEGETLSLDGSQMTERGLNAFLMQWKFGQRELWRCNFTFPNRIDMDRVLMDLEANVLWTPEDHSNSIISMFTTVDLTEFLPNPPRIYVVYPSYDLDDYRVVRYYQNKIEISYYNDPTDAIIQLLSNRHQIQLLGSCPECYVDTCRHTREVFGAINAR